MIISSAMTKLISRDDLKVIARGICLADQGFQFQLLLDKKTRFDEKIVVESDISDHVTVFRVYDMKGSYEHPLNPKTDPYYIKSTDEKYPDLLRKVDTVTTEQNEKCVLLIDVSSKIKAAGEHTVKITVGDESAQLVLDVADQSLADTDLLLTNWFHIDGLCNYYGVAPFSEAFYARFESFLDAYVGMGNNMMLLPAFTAPLDTEVGRERLTTQLVKVEKAQNTYIFDFSLMEKFIDVCRERGIRYFEHSHLFTQWGGEYCPKIIVTQDGNDTNAFGWSVSSTDERYLDFLAQYLEAFQNFLDGKGMANDVYMHLTDEPRPEHFERYLKLSAFIKQHCSLKTMDALSEKEFAAAVDMPVVALSSGDLSLFDENKMLYYCVCVDLDHITNRYLHMPLQRTEILGFQLYANNAKGFLHWGFNFYNTQLSKGTVNPYEDTMAGGGFPAGDGFIVYPGEKEAEPSVRYYSLKRAFEDYRLLKTLEAKVGRKQVMQMLDNEGISGVHKYPRSVEWHEDFRERIIALIKE